jgi:hypothetical protein
MNKARRHELKMLKYKKRLKQLRLKESPVSNLFAYRSHGSPCSCWGCQAKGKYDRAKSRRGISDKEVYGQNAMSL